MKSKKNVIALCLCILMLFSLACVCSASTLSENGASQQVMVADRATDSDNTLGYSNEELKSMNQFDKSFLSKANSAYEAHEKLINSFGAPEIKASDFPEYYGGDYIDDEGNLVVYVASNSNDYQQRFLQSIGSAKVIFKPSKYSFKSLTEIYTKCL